jgi:hypothetical protein
MEYTLNGMSVRDGSGNIFLTPKEVAASGTSLTKQYERKRSCLCVRNVAGKETSMA